MYKSYIMGVGKLECSRIRRLQTYIQGCNMEPSAYWPGGERQEFRALMRQILNEIGMVCSAIRVSDEAFSAHKTQIEATELSGWIKETVKMMTIRLTIEKEFKGLEGIKLRESLETQDDPVSTVTLQGEIQDLEGIMFIESLDAQVDDLVTSLGQEEDPELQTLSTDRKRIVTFEGSVEWCDATEKLLMARILNPSLDTQEDDLVSTLTPEKEIKNLERIKFKESLDAQDDDFVASLTLEKEIKDPKRNKLKESLDIQEDDLVSTLGCVRHSQEEVEVPELPETLSTQWASPLWSRDQKRILTTKGSVEWSAARPAIKTENVWVKRASPPFLENNGKRKRKRRKKKERKRKWKIPYNPAAENINENRNVSLENEVEGSNDSAIFSADADSDVKDTNSEIKSNVGSEPGDEDSYSVISLDQIRKQDTSKSASNERNNEKLVQGIRNHCKQAPPAHVGAGAPAAQVGLTPRVEVRLNWFRYLVSGTMRCRIGPDHSEKLRKEIYKFIMPQTEIYKSGTPSPGDAERRRSQSS